MIDPFIYPAPSASDPAPLASDPALEDHDSDLLASTDDSVKASLIDSDSSDDKLSSIRARLLELSGTKPVGIGASRIRPVGLGASRIKPAGIGASRIRPNGLGGLNRLKRSNHPIISPDNIKLKVFKYQE